MNISVFCRRLLSMSAVIGLIATTHTVSAQSVSSYGFFHRTNYTQSSASGSTLSSFPYAFYAEVLGSNLNNYSSTTYSGSASGTLATPPSGENSADTKLYFDTTSRDNAYPLGNYTLDLDGTTSTLNLSAGLDPNQPQISGGIWDSGRLQVADGGFTFSFNTPVNTDVVRLHIYQQSGAFESYRYEGDGSATSFFVPDEALTLGVNYGAALDYINVVDTDTAYSGATGRAGHMARNSFQFTVTEVPEPGVTALGFGAAAVGLILFRRRLRA